MNKFEFPADYRTSVYINASNSITVQQVTDYMNDPWESVIFSSKARACAVAQAILELAESASFEEPQDAEGEE